jgi:hypothetical protein
MSHLFKGFAPSLKSKLLNLSSNYAQANRQAESSSKILIKKKIEERPRRTHTE